MSEIKDFNEEKKNALSALDQGLGKIKETTSKDQQTKINEKIKAAYDAYKILIVLLEEIKDLEKEKGVCSKILNDFAKLVK